MTLRKTTSKIKIIMKKLIFPIFILLFIFSSCHKEEIIIDKKEVIDPPIEINNALFSGRIIHDNIGVAGADIYIYQKGEKLGKVVSDQDGYYSTKDIDLEIGKDVTFEIKTENYLTKIKRKALKKVQSEKVNFNLHLKTDNPLEKAFYLEDPGDTTLVKVFGTFTDINGNPITNAIVFALWDFVKTSPHSWQGYGSLDYTDDSGYFELLVKKEKEIYFHSTKWEDVECSQVINVTDNKTLIEGMELQYIGVIDNDFEIIERNDISFDKTENLIRGTFLNCDGTPVTSGEIKITVKMRLDTNYYSVVEKYTITDFDSEGNFQIETSRCKKGDITFLIYGKTSDEYSYYNEIPFQEGTIELGEIKACKDIKSYPMFFSINIGDEKSFDKIDVIRFGDNESGIKFLSFSLTESCGIEMKDIKIGTNEIIYFGFGNFNKPDWGFRAENREIKAIVTKIENDFIYGTFEGEVETNGLGKQTITGEFQFHF